MGGSGARDDQAGDDKMTESNVFDIQTRAKVVKVENKADDNVQIFMKRWAKTAKDGRFKSVFILAIDEDNFCDWGFLSDNEYHEALACITLEDLREEIKDSVMGYEEIDEDEED